MSGIIYVCQKCYERLVETANGHLYCPVCMSHKISEAEVIQQHSKIDITIKNFKDDTPVNPWQIRVDRSSYLGNPYRMDNECDRDAVCDKYEEWFLIAVLNRIKGYPNAQLEFERLKDIYRKYGKLELFCWCAPKRCHAETIKKYLKNILNEED